MPSPDFDGSLKENTMQNITLTLTLDEVNGILNLMSKTETGSGFFPLMVKVKEQAEAQLPKPTE